MKNKIWNYTFWEVNLLWSHSSHVRAHHTSISCKKHPPLKNVNGIIQRKVLGESKYRSQRLTSPLQRSCASVKWIVSGDAKRNMLLWQWFKNLNPTQQTILRAHLEKEIKTSQLILFPETLLQVKLSWNMFFDVFCWMGYTPENKHGT